MGSFVSYITIYIPSIVIINLTPNLYIYQPIKRRKEGEEKKMTQEEMLLEAAQTGS